MGEKRQESEQAEFAQSEAAKAVTTEQHTVKEALEELAQLRASLNLEEFGKAEVTFFLLLSHGYALSSVDEFGNGVGQLVSLVLLRCVNQQNES